MHNAFRTQYSLHTMCNIKLIDRKPKDETILFFEGPHVEVNL